MTLLIQSVGSEFEGGGRNGENMHRSTSSLDGVGHLSCFAIATTPSLGKDDEKSTPHGYAEAVVAGSWSLWGHPYYYQTHHQAITNPSNLTGTAVLQHGKSGGVVYNVTINFVGRALSSCALP